MPKLKPSDQLKLLEKDEEIVKRINHLCKELELAIQEATNSGLSVEYARETYGLTSYLSRPLRCIITRYMSYGE